MAVKLRLKRMGKTHQPFYRIVAADSRSPRDGRFIETVGTYNPVKGSEVVTIDEEKVLTWLKNGAQPTDTVRSIFVKQGIMKKYANTKAPAKKKEKKEVVKKETPAKKTTAAKKTTTTKKTTATKTTTKKKAK